MIQEKTDTIKMPASDNGTIPSKLPVLPLRDVVVYPFMTYPVLLGRESSLKAATAAIERNKYVFLAAQKSPDIEEPTKDDVYTGGTIARIGQIVKLANGLMKIVVEGLAQGLATAFLENDQFLEATVRIPQLAATPPAELEALVRHAAALFEEFVTLNRNLTPETVSSFNAIADPQRKLYLAAASVSQSVEVKQRILQMTSLNEQYVELSRLLSAEIDILKIEKDIDTKVHDSIQKSQKKFLIQEQIRILQDELGSEEVLSPELAKLQSQIKKAGMPREVRERAMEEFTKLKKTPPQSPEFGVGRNYLDWLVAIPWQARTKDNLDMKHVERILNEDHFGLEKPKERILEHIAVLNLVKEMKGQILCFVGPPGVGKTSLGKSIARALGRKFVRISLGGVRDEIGRAHV
jgi:ATP-dependent Lon protease